MREKFRDIRRTLNTDIFVGERYEKNLNNITVMAIIIIVIGCMMTLINAGQGRYAIAVYPLLILIAGIGTLISVIKFRSRRGATAISIPTILIVFTVELLVADNGFAYLWMLLVPLAVCYMFSVKLGVYITAYLQLLLVIVFLTPIRRVVASHYTEIAMSRFPLLFFFNGLLVIVVMYRYQKSVIFEIRHTNILNEEVKKQTAVAEERSRRIEQMSYQTIQTLANAIDAKDPYTKGHSTRVSQYSVYLAEALGWDKDRVDNLKYAALLHDIGKIGVPDSILNKPGRLTDMEYDIIKTHTTMGGNILKNRIMIAGAEDVARSHHERYDGGGYPEGRRGKEISEEARIVAIADAFDAMSSNRVYRKACTEEHIREEFTKGKGRQFDPDYADVFLDLWERGCFEKILENEDDVIDEKIEESSVLLQEAVNAFTSNESGNKEEMAGEPVEAEKLMESLKESAERRGAKEVEYKQFVQLYEYIVNLEKRFKHPFRLVMITLTPCEGEEPGTEELEKSMYYLEHSIRRTIRDVDIVTRYSRQQFLVILLGSDEQGVKSAMERTFRGYYKMIGNSVFTPEYYSISS